MPIRVLNLAGEAWFVARDVAELLGYAAARTVAAYGKGALIQCIPSPSGEQQTTIIPERDVYRLMRSKMPAEAFEEWVVGRVLPAIELPPTLERRAGMSISYSAVVSSLALAVSCLSATVGFLSAYHTTLFIKHDLQMFIPTPDRQEGAENVVTMADHWGQFEQTIVLMNYGNMTETVTGAALVAVPQQFRDKPPPEGMTSGPVLGPYVLKPGDATTVQLQIYYDTINMWATQDNEKRALIQVRVAALTQDGPVTVRRVQFAAATIALPPPKTLWGFRISYSKAGVANVVKGGTVADVRRFIRRLVWHKDT